MNKRADYFTLRACLSRAVGRVLVWTTFAGCALVYCATYVGPEVVIK